MRFLRFLLPVLVVSFIILAPSVSSAATASFFGPIISPECHCPQSAPDWGCVLQTVQNVVNVSISIGVLVAVVIIAYAGFLFMFSPLNAHNREMGRTLLLNAVIGLAIALSAWLIVDFVMKTVYNDDSGFGPWNTIIGASGQTCLTVRATPEYTGGRPEGNNPGVSAGGSGEPARGADTRTEAEKATAEREARERLSSRGVSVNNAACGVNVNGVQRGCTDVSLVNNAALGLAMSIDLACRTGSAAPTDCDTVITGGSELGHSNGHTNGHKIDIRPTAAINAYFLRVLTRDTSHDRGGDSGGSAYTDTCGNIYVRETDHWDIDVRSNCNMPRNNN